ncbi:hypothetical protein TrLO_g1034 [Triparma laevis f. longispina]|uniref:EF-hand domain-containing protein n=1 Tax=Triparma laevis f. longispina TaxID=1714387 RepID=A0A9W7A880_9STRA|nr:hypothetical protein TrLO_g1034 [Triparma laevis f. longispina]
MNLLVFLLSFTSLISTSAFLIAPGLTPPSTSTSSFLVSPRTSTSTSLSAKKAKFGIFSPLVETTKLALGEQELTKLRGKVIQEHSKVIAKFVDTSDSKFGRIALKALFEAADDNGDGVLTVSEVQAACNALGFSWIDEEKSSTLVSRADVDENAVIDFEEFINTTPKVLRANLVRLAKENGNDLGFLV